MQRVMDDHTCTNSVCVCVSTTHTNRCAGDAHARNAFVRSHLTNGMYLHVCVRACVYVETLDAQPPSARVKTVSVS